MKDKYNYLWLGIIVISLAGFLFLVRAAYENPLGLPDYAFIKSGIKEAYSFAKFNPEKLEGLPCNCGCMNDASAHGGRLHSRGLIDCFMVGNINGGGQWDMHASECGLCYEDALLAKEKYEEGRTKEEIKMILEEKYSKQTFSDDTVYGDEDE